MEEQNMVGMQEETLHQKNATGGPETGGAAAADTQDEAGGEEVISIVELLYGDAAQGEEGDGAQTADDPTDSHGQADAANEPGRTYTQREFDAAVRRKIEMASRSMQEKLEADPFYRLGRRIAEGEDMREELGGPGTPGSLPSGLQAGTAEGPAPALGQTAQALPSREAIQALAAKPAVAKIGQELFRTMLEGGAPQDIRVAEYVKIYPQFISDCARFGVKAALQTVNALQGAQAQQQAALERAMRNRALPQPTRPTSNALPSGEIDYASMSAAEFKKLKEEVRKARLAGKKVRL